jgi:hypothetical protein
MMRLDNVSFKFYMNSSCGLDGNPPCHSVGPHTDDSPVCESHIIRIHLARYLV